MTGPSDADRELSELRARAYGADSDIDADPAALARLVELEDAHLAASAPDHRPEGSPGFSKDVEVPAAPAPVDPSAAADATDEVTAANTNGTSWQALWERAVAPRNRRARLTAGAIAVVALSASGLAWLFGPHPDATMPVIIGGPDTELVASMEQLRMADVSTLREYEAYRDVRLWSFVDTQGSICLVGYHWGGTGRFQFDCVPPGTELFLDMNVWPSSNDGFGDWLPGGSVIRFHLRQDAVDVHVYPASSTG